MYVPALAGMPSEERGHVNYQHPQRNAEFGPEVDRFSAIVIYLALKAITPTLWHKYSAGGENILFNQDDFRTPRTSRLLAELEAVPDLKSLVQNFRRICESGLAKVPRLADFLSGNIPTTVSVPIKLATRRSQYKVLDATKRDELVDHVGEVVTIIGKIIEYKSGHTKNGAPYAYLNFGDWKTGDFRLVLWSDTLDLFEQNQKDIASYNQQWISVTGLLQKFVKGTRTHPQIIIDTISQIEILTDKEEADRRLVPNVNMPTKPAPPPNLEKPSAAKTSVFSQSNQAPTVQPPTGSPTNITDITDLINRKKPSNKLSSSKPSPLPQAKILPAVHPLPPSSSPLKVANPPAQAVSKLNLPPANPPPGAVVPPPAPVPSPLPAAPTPKTLSNATPNLDKLLQYGIRTAREGNNPQAARLIFERVLEMNKREERAWLWLAALAKTKGERRQCLEAVLYINPKNEVAQRGLTAMESVRNNNQRRTLRFGLAVVVLLAALGISVLWVISLLPH